MMDPLTRAVRPIQHRRTKKPLSVEVQNAYKTLLVTVVILSLGTGGAFLYVNSLKPAKGYLLKKLQSEYEDLQSAQRKLNQESIEAQSFIHIQNSDVLQEMEATKKSETSFIEDSSIAEAETNSSTH